MTLAATTPLPIVTAMVTYATDSPLIVHGLLLLAALLFFIDGITGTATSLVRGEYRSKVHREKFFSKSLQYFMIFSIGLSGSFFIYLVYPVAAWIILCLVLGFICSTEIGSIWENVILMEKMGVSVRALTPLIEKTRKMFAVSGTQYQQGAVRDVTESMMVITSPVNQPMAIIPDPEFMSNPPSTKSQHPSHPHNPPQYGQYHAPQPEAPPRRDAHPAQDPAPREAAPADTVEATPRREDEPYPEDGGGSDIPTFRPL
jgi:hypothetical protein